MVARYWVSKLFSSCSGRRKVLACFCFLDFFFFLVNSRLLLRKPGEGGSNCYLDIRWVPKGCHEPLVVGIH